MTKVDIDAVLAATLEDRRLSRGERHAIKELILDWNPRPERLAFYRHRAFALAKEAMEGHENVQIVEWLEDVVKAFLPEMHPGDGVQAEVHFSPGGQCLEAIRRQLSLSRKAVDICVFTITDDRLASAILTAHGRGVQVRIITDDDKAFDKGSDIYRMAQAGIAVRADESRHHMHHKFAIFDNRTVVTGSYNWTRSAAEYNRENILVTDDLRLVRPYEQMFTQFWNEIGRNSSPGAPPKHQR